MIFVGTTTTIRMRTKKDLSGLTAKIMVKKPDLSSVEWTGTILGSTVSYTTNETDLDIPGNYLLWVEATGTGVDWASSVKGLLVYARGTPTV